MEIPTKDIPEMKQRFPGEALIRVRKDPLAFLRDLADMGDCSKLQTYPLPPLYVINHPDLFKEVLVTQNDSFIKGRGVQLMSILLGKGLFNSEFDFHRSQRKLVLPAFHHSRLSIYGERMVDIAARKRDTWKHNRIVPIEEEMTLLTLDIVAKTLFGADMRGVESTSVTRALIDFQNAFVKMVNPFTEFLMKLPLPETRKIKQSRKVVDETIYRIINEHRQNPEAYDDLLSMLLAARDEETGHVMDNEQVRDEAITLFIAGHETTAVALTWFWYVLAQHPEVERRLHEELDDVLQGRLPAFADVPKLTYTRQVLSEVLRLYPPAWLLTREAIEDVTIGGYAIPKNATIDMSPYFLHHDERFWPDPERFDPERFAPENKGTRKKFTFLPFGTGVRGCIGEQFAWTEAILVIATLAQRWTFTLIEKDPVPPLPILTLHPARSIPMRVEQRA